jgi:DNA-binding IclR family transcriptional regulator
MCTAGTNFITIAEAAGYLETTETRILMMLKKQELIGRQDESGSWQIDKASLQLCGKPRPADIVKKGCGGGCGSGCGGH